MTTKAAKPGTRPAAKRAPAATKAPVRARRTAPAKPAPAAAEKARPKANRKAEAGKRGDKVMRDGYTIPKAEHAVLQALKDRAVRLGRPAKKSEVLRAGVMALAAMTDAGFKAAIARVPPLKTGRPAGK